MYRPSFNICNSARSRILPGTAAVGALLLFAAAIHAADKSAEPATRIPTPLIADKSLLPPPTVAGHKTGLIPREVLFGNPDKAMARMSHDGKWLSYLAPVDGVLNVWVGPIDDPAAAKPVTKEKDRPIRRLLLGLHEPAHPLLARRERRRELARLRRRSRVGRNQGPHAARADQKVRAEIEEVSYKFPEEILVGLNDRDPQFHDVYRVQHRDGREEAGARRTTSSPASITDDDYQIRFASKFTPDGGKRAAEARRQGGWNDFLKIPQADTLTTGIAVSTRPATSST